MKKCSACEEEKELDEFWRASQSKDGRDSVCRFCRNSGEYGKKKRAYLRKYISRHQRENGEKMKARRMARRAWKIGEIKKGKCQECGSPDTEIHHPDYSKPLEIIWLCKLHHQQLHARLRGV